MESTSPGKVEGGTPAVTASSRYEELAELRRPFLDRAREASRLTIPGLLPPEGTNGSTTLYQPFQSKGAEGVNNLAAKLLLVLFPPGTSFFRIGLNEAVLDELQKASPQENAESVKALFEEALAKLERAVVTRMEEKGARTVNYEFISHLIVTGNGLLFVDKEGKEKFFPLESYVVKRDLSGNVLEIITKESLAKTTLPPQVRALVSEQDKDPKDGEQKSIDLFTWIRRTDSGSWTVHQEVCGKQVPESDGTYAKDKCPWIAGRWRMVAGQDYGRGRCEEFIGDLLSLEGLTQSIVEFSAIASRVNPMVDPGGVTDPEEWAKTPNGKVVRGNAKDITYSGLQTKTADFQITANVAEKIETRLERAFLMTSAVQRQAERVTAEEIRAMVGELDKSLGGVYSILANEYQRSLVTVLIHQLMAAGDIPNLPSKGYSLQIIAGLDGLGRNADLQKLDEFIAGNVELLGQEAVAQAINPSELFRRRATALGIDAKGLIRSEQEIQATQQQQMQAQLAEKAVGPGIQLVGKQMEAQQQQEQA